jgi:hypothetical protein
VAVTDVVTRLTTTLAERYRVERELGAGGMATVYLAHDLRHERDVAIKVLHPDLGAALGGERFLAEIRTTARLQHPHILPLLDSGEAAGLLYCVASTVVGSIRAGAGMGTLARGWGGRRASSRRGGRAHGMRRSVPRQLTSERGVTGG